MSIKPPRRTSSGEHSFVTDFRKKLDSVRDGVLEDLADLNKALDEEIAKVKSSKPPPPLDPRREPDDPRADEGPPVDVVAFDDDEPDTIPRKRPPPLPIGRLAPQEKKK